MDKLGFGFLRLPQTDPEDSSTIIWEKLYEMVDLFIENGGSYFDTAYTYLDGFSEKALCKSVVKRHPREKLIIADKLPSWEITSPQMCRTIFDEQRKRCGVDYFDVYLLHWLNRENYQISETHREFDFLKELKKSGEARRIGISYHDNAELLDRILQEHPEIEIVQLQINYLDWKSDGIQAEACYETAVKYGKSVVVMEPVKGGALAELPAEAKQLFSQLDPEKSDAYWAIKFARSLENVEIVLSGMSTTDQIQDNMNNEGYLTEKERIAVEAAAEILQRVTAIPCTACRYCAGKCPKNIPIPDFFSMYNEYCRNKEEDWKIVPSYEALAEKRGAKASDCIACSICEKSCPQGIAISEWMKKLVDDFDNYVDED